MDLSAQNVLRIDAIFHFRGAAGDVQKRNDEHAYCLNDAIISTTAHDHRYVPLRFKQLRKLSDNSSLRFAIVLARGVYESHTGGDYLSWPLTLCRGVTIGEALVFSHPHEHPLFTVVCAFYDFFIKFFQFICNLQGEDKYKSNRLTDRPIDQPASRLSHELTTKSTKPNQPAYQPYQPTYQPNNTPNNQLTTHKAKGSSKQIYQSTVLLTNTVNFASIILCLTVLFLLDLP